jgi:uncharacterized membrane protein YtjA (UPF0391 family)
VDSSGFSRSGSHAASAVPSPGKHRCALGTLPEARRRAASATHNSTRARSAGTAQIFAVIAFIAAALGLTGIETGAADIARPRFRVFVALVAIFRMP